MDFVKMHKLKILILFSILIVCKVHMYFHYVRKMYNRTSWFIFASKLKNQEQLRETERESKLIHYSWNVNGIMCNVQSSHSHNAH